MDALAPTDLVLRADLDAMSDADLRARLEDEAPEDAERIHANDRRRTIRALERAAAEEGTPTTARAWDGPPREDFVAIGLEWPVESINRRINARVKAMAADGLIDEVRALHHANRLGRQAWKPRYRDRGSPRRLLLGRRCLRTHQDRPGDGETTTDLAASIQNSSRTVWLVQRKNHG